MKSGKLLFSLTHNVSRLMPKDTICQGQMLVKELNKKANTALAGLETSDISFVR